MFIESVWIAQLFAHPRPRRTWRTLWLVRRA